LKENFNLSDLSVRCSGQTGARMKKYMVAKYIRLSMEDLDLCNSEEKAESVSISNQRNFIDTFIEQGEEFQGAEIKEFVDKGAAPVMQAGRNRLHYRKGFVTFWTKLSGSWRLFGTDFPVFGCSFYQHQ